MLQKVLLTIFVVAAWVSAGTAAFAAENIGVVVAVVGAPSASGPNGNRKLSKDSDVFENDTIRVSTGNAQIILNDGTRLVVGPESTLLLDQFVMRGKKSADKIAIKGLRGTYRFITGRSAKSAYKISTAHGTIGIRGTAFDFWVRGKTGAVVLRGKVNLKSEAGNSININTGCQMGETSKSSAKPIAGKAKNNAIKTNLPFLINQSSLSRRFRLDVTTCRLGPPTTEGGGSVPRAPEQRQSPDRYPTNPPNPPYPSDPNNPP